MDETGALRYQCSKAVQGNVVDLAYTTHQNCLIYAVDTVHQALSQFQVEDRNVWTGRVGIGILQYSAMIESWEVDLDLQEAVGHAVDSAPKDDGLEEDKAVGASSESLLYSLEKLRKRNQEE